MLLGAIKKLGVWCIRSLREDRRYIPPSGSNIKEILPYFTRINLFTFNVLPVLFRGDGVRLVLQSIQATDARENVLYHLLILSSLLRGTFLQQDFLAVFLFVARQVKSLGLCQKGVCPLLNRQKRDALENVYAK